MKKVCIAIIAATSIVCLPTYAQKTHRKTGVHHASQAVKKLEEAKKLLVDLNKRLASPGMVPGREIEETFTYFNEKLLAIIDTNLAQDETTALSTLLTSTIDLQEIVNTLSTKQLRAKLEQLITSLTASINRLNRVLMPAAAAVATFHHPKPTHK